MATTLVKGSVQVKRKDAEVVLKPNQHAVVGNVMNVITVTEVDVEEIICWKDNMFFFRDVELEKILDQLAEWYGFTVFYENADAVSYTHLGLLYLGSFFSLLAAFVVLWQMITLGLDKEEGSMSVVGNVLANDTRVLYGAYQIVIAGICLPFGAFLFRDRKRR